MIEKKWAAKITWLINSIMAGKLGNKNSFFSKLKKNRKKERKKKRKIKFRTILNNIRAQTQKLWKIFFILKWIQIKKFKRFNQGTAYNLENKNMKNKKPCILIAFFKKWIDKQYFRYQNKREKSE